MKIGKFRLSGWLTLAVVATVGGAMVATDPAFALTNADKFTLGMEGRLRYEVRVGTTFGATAANASDASHRIRVTAGYDLTPDVALFAQLQDARFYGSEVSPTATDGATGALSSSNTNGTGLDLHQGYIQVKNLLVPGLSLKLGRQEITFGDHRLLGNYYWSQVGQSFDGVRLTLAGPDADKEMKECKCPTALDLFWARVLESEFGTSAATPATGSQKGVVFPSSGTRSTLDQDLYGAYLTLRMAPKWTIEPYYFLLKDNRIAGTTVLTTPQASNQTRSTVGGRLAGKGGGLDLTLEAAYQFGRIASGLTGGNTRDLHINAHAEAAKIGFTFKPVPFQPRLGFEFNYASGDGGNAAGGRNSGNFNTFDNLYPTNHVHYGYMDLMAWRNMVNYQAVFDIKPSPVSKFQVNFIVHRLASTKDHWYRSQGQVYGVSGVGNAAASLGQELNAHYAHTFKDKFRFELGYGHFFAGEYIEKARRFGTATVGGVRPGGADQDWWYGMASVLF